MRVARVGVSVMVKVALATHMQIAFGAGKGKHVQNPCNQLVACDDKFIV